MRPAHINAKFKRRSRSAGPTRVLDHQPVVKVPAGTVFQPKLPKDTRHTTRPDAKDLKKCTEYMITHQETDEMGNLSQDLIKVRMEFGGGELGEKRAINWVNV